MKTNLVRCPSCKRHIYESETSCPFCSRQTNASTAVFVAALSAGLAVAGCAAETPQPRQPLEVAPPPNDPPAPDPGTAPAYGGPPPVVTAPVIQPPAAAYGAPPPMSPSPVPPGPNPRR
jgi:hypothetical protein